MQIDESFRVKAPIQKVWEFLSDIEKLGSCFPEYVKKLERIDHRNYSSTVKAKVGFISATFEGIMTITKEEPPYRLEWVTKGKDSLIASVVNQKNSFYLKPLSEGETEVVYKAETNVGGKLATVGDKVIRGKAKQLALEFTQIVRQRLEEPGELEEENKKGRLRWISNTLNQRLLKRLVLYFRDIVWRGGK